MSTMLNDGTIVPSYLMPVSTPTSEGDDSFGNFPVREGVVKTVLYPEPQNDIKSLRYVVTVDHRDMSGRATRSDYVCKVATLFGSPADRMKYTLRPAPSVDEKDKTDSYVPGSKVLVVCVNGEKNRAYIIGGLDDAKASVDPGKEEGAYFDFEFNGLNATVNKDGELTLTMKGPTNFDGTPTKDVVAENVGTTLSFTKEGNVTIEHGDQKVVLDHANKKMQVIGTDEVQVKAKTVKVEGDSVVLGLGGEPLIKGSTFRAAQKSLHTAIQTAAKAANVAMAPVGGACVASITAAPAAPGFVAMIAFLTALDGAFAAFESVDSALLSQVSKTS